MLNFTNEERKKKWQELNAMCDDCPVRGLISENNGCGHCSIADILSEIGKETDKDIAKDKK